MGNTQANEAASASPSSSSGTSSLSALRKALSKSENKDIDWSSYELPDETLNSDIEVGSDIEKELCDVIIDALPESVGEAMEEQLFRNIAMACLRFRRYDVASASERLRNYVLWRSNIVGLEEQDLGSDEALRRQVRTGFIRVLPGRCDGRAIMVLRLKHHNPTECDALLAVKAWHYVIMDCVLNDPGVQKNGIIMISDLEGAAFSNMDVEIPRTLIRAIAKNLPLRLFAVAVVRPFLIMNIILPIMKLLMSAKMASRIHNLGTDIAALQKPPLNIDEACLDAALGGSCEYDHGAQFQ